MRTLVACGHCHAQYDVSEYGHGALRCRCGMLLLISPPRPVERPICRCGACGAPMEANAERCTYCGGVVSKDAFGLICPECFAQMPADSRFCRACGVPIHPEVLRARPTALACPACPAPLFERRIAEYPVAECGHCHGIWVGIEVFARLINTLATDRAKLAEPQSAGGAHPGAAGPVRYRKCPRCQQLMNRKNFEGISGIILDQCHCGWWFDATELEGVARFVAEGGLAKARRMEEEYQASRRESEGQKLLDELERRPKSPSGVFADGFLALLGLGRF